MVTVATESFSGIALEGKMAKLGKYPKVLLPARSCGAKKEANESEQWARRS